MAINQNMFHSDPQPQFHYDIGYGGVFAHYRSETPPDFDPKKVVNCLMAIKQYKDKGGFRLDNVGHLFDQMQELSNMGFYLVNFETKKMSEDVFNSALAVSDC